MLLNVKTKKVEKVITTPKDRIGHPLGLIHMYPATESGRSESSPFVIVIFFFMTVFIRSGPAEDNTVSECIRSVTATYACKILQLYEHDANVYGYDANCE